MATALEDSKKAVCMATSCSYWEVPQYHQSTGCTCRRETMREAFLGPYDDNVDYRPVNIYKRQDTPTSTAAATFTGKPTPLPSEVNASSPAAITFIPPPKTDLTPALIQESLNQQTQQTADIISATPYFMDGTIVFGVQLQGGPVVTIIYMNASTTIPCGTIGADPEPGLIVVPFNVVNGTAQIMVNTCLVIAVNIYKPTIITFWVQKSDGDLFSVSSDAKIHDLDKINTTLPAFADILTTDTPFTRRDGTMPTIKLAKPQALGARDLEEINPYTTLMTKEACAAMFCKSNNGTQALYNPFMRTCYCQTLQYAQVNPNSDTVQSS